MHTNHCPKTFLSQTQTDATRASSSIISVLAIRTAAAPRAYAPELEEGGQVAPRERRRDPLGATVAARPLDEDCRGWCPNHQPSGGQEGGPRSHGVSRHRRRPRRASVSAVRRSGAGVNRTVGQPIIDAKPGLNDLIPPIFKSIINKIQFIPRE